VLDTFQVLTRVVNVEKSEVDAIGMAYSGMRNTKEYAAATDAVVASIVKDVQEKSGRAAEEPAAAPAAPVRETPAADAS